MPTPADELKRGEELFGKRGRGRVDENRAFLQANADWRLAVPVHRGLGDLDERLGSAQVGEHDFVDVVGRVRAQKLRTELGRVVGEAVVGVDRRPGGVVDGEGLFPVAGGSDARSEFGDERGLEAGEFKELCDERRGVGLRVCGHASEGRGGVGQGRRE